jgi:hypothetical protein
MPISFEACESTIAARDYYHRMAVEHMRPVSARYDQQEHAFPKEWVDYFWEEGRGGPGGNWQGPHDGMVRVCVQAEELCWGDAAL